MPLIALLALFALPVVGVILAAFVLRRRRARRKPPAMTAEEQERVRQRLREMS